MNPSPKPSALGPQRLTGARAGMKCGGLLLQNVWLMQRHSSHGSKPNRCVGCRAFLCAVLKNIWLPYRTMSFGGGDTGWSMFLAKHGWASQPVSESYTVEPAIREEAFRLRTSEG